MKISLLSTKFNIPPRSERLVARPRLLQRMHEGLRQDCLLTLICAPAGYGKTTLVNDWLHYLKAGQPGEITQPAALDWPKKIAWLTLDAGDDDLGRFLAYLVAALQPFQAEIGQGILETIQTTRPPAAQTLATWLINDLATIPDRFVLVLDDYHLVSAQPIHDLLAYMIEHQPPQMCMIIATRADPPLPLARLRARGQLVELRQEDLCFTGPETQMYLQTVMGLKLTSEQLTTLENRTEGWVAGLQLAALSMRNIEDIPTFISAFSGGNVHIADFLADEVLSQQPPAVKTFLLQTSILDRLSAPICEAVTRQPQAQEILQKLKEENLFLIPLDHQQEWFRYHALFADLLRKRLHQTQAKMVGEYHCRASHWYQENELPEQAIEHALAGCDYSLAAGLVEKVGETILKRGEAQTLLRWLEALPDDEKQSRPMLFVFYGLVLIVCGQPPDQALLPLENIISTGNVDEIVGELSTFQGLLAMMQGKIPQAIQLTEKALQHLAPQRTFFRSLAADNLGMAYILLGDSAAAAKAFEQAVEIAEQSDNLMLALGALSNLAGLLVLQGKLRAAAKSYDRIIDLAEERLGNRSQQTGKAQLGLGMLAREWNDLEGALHYYEEAAEMFRHSVEIGLPIVYLSMAMVKLNQGDSEAMQAYLDRARQYSHATTTTKLDDKLTEETQARIWALQGKTDLLEEWLKLQGYLSPEKMAELTSTDPRTAAKILADQNIYLTLARFYLTVKQPAQAQKVLDPLLDLFMEKGHGRRVIEILALKALALKGQGQLDAAMQVLDQVLALAEPEGYQRTFLDEGEPMAQLLYQAASRGIYPAYIGKLLAAFSHAVPSISNEVREIPLEDQLIEPLSERELEVLVLIAGGLSNQEIAARLHISLSTVKSHASQIYSKLNVSNRTQAVARARSLGLIPFI